MECQGFIGEVIDFIEKFACDRHKRLWPRIKRMDTDKSESITAEAVLGAVNKVIEVLWGRDSLRKSMNALWSES